MPHILSFSITSLVSKKVGSVIFSAKPREEQLSAARYSSDLKQGETSEAPRTDDSH